MQIKPIVLHVLRGELTEAAADFTTSQASAKWQRLEDAMWALQYASQRDEAQLTAVSEQIGVGKWPEHFAKVARSLANSK